MAVHQPDAVREVFRRARESLRESVDSIGLAVSS